MPKIDPVKNLKPGDILENGHTVKTVEHFTNQFGREKVRVAFTDGSNGVAGANSRVILRDNQGE